jgi:hypothetical protein
VKTVVIELLVYSMLKDDILIVTEALEKGTKFINEKLVIDAKKKEVDENKSDSKVTMEVLK